MVNMVGTDPSSSPKAFRRENDEPVGWGSLLVPEQHQQRLGIKLTNYTDLFIAEV